jgi:hypothetical protein
MRRATLRWILTIVGAAAIASVAYFGRQQMEDARMHTIPAGLRAFNVNAPIPTCGRWKDTMPKSRDPDAYRLYINARKLWRSKIEWQLTRQEALGVLNDVKAAANKGDWGARALMAHFYLSGLGPLGTNHVLDPDPDKSVEILRMAVAAGQAWGYYDLGVAYEHGYGGAPQDEAIAWAYYLRGAELGSPDAQMALASAYGRAKRDDAEQAMIMCAYKQGHGPAAYELAVNAEVFKNFAAALEYYQAGTKFGSTGCAAALMLIFAPREWSLLEKADQEAFTRLEIMPDAERSDRYNQISNALDINPDLRLTRLDQVLPLPPAELPAWHGIKDAVEPDPSGPPSY